MIRYLMRVGLEVDVVSDGSQCVDAVLSHPHDYYCLVLCDLFMPVKGKPVKVHQSNITSNP